MKTKKELKEIETEINYLLMNYDKANKEGDKESLDKTSALIEYELGKLDKNEIYIKTEPS